MEQIIPDNEDIEEYFDEDELNAWSSIEDSMEWGTLENLRDALNCWVDDIYDKGIPEDTKLQYTAPTPNIRCAANPTNSLRTILDQSDKTNHSFCHLLAQALRSIPICTSI